MHPPPVAGDRKAAHVVVCSERPFAELGYKAGAVHGHTRRAVARIGEEGDLAGGSLPCSHFVASFGRPYMQRGLLRHPVWKVRAKCSFGHELAESDCGGK